MATLLSKSYELPALDFKTSGPWNKDTQPHMQKMEELQDISDALPEGEIVGGIISFGVADGSAIYLVTKAKPLTLQHIDFCDAYRVHPAMIRGLRKQDILDQLGSRRRMQSYFSKRKKKEVERV